MILIIKKLLFTDMYLDIKTLYFTFYLHDYLYINLITLPFITIFDRTYYSNLILCNLQL